MKSFFSQIKIASQTYDSQWNILYCEITNMGFIMINFPMCPICLVSLECILLLEIYGYQPTHPWLTVSNIYIWFLQIYIGPPSPLLSHNIDTLHIGFLICSLWFVFLYDHIYYSSYICLIWSIMKEMWICFTEGNYMTIMLPKEEIMYEEKRI